MLFAILIWTALTYIIDLVNMKSNKISKILKGVPSIIIEDGQIDFKVMKKEKVDFSELLCLLRQKDIFSIQEVVFAFVETSGTISVQKTSQTTPPNRTELNIPSPNPVLTLPVILDGKIMLQNLSHLKVDETWLDQQLKANQIKDPQEVLYAEWDQSKFYYQKYKKGE
jgi:uncharacterized membrane protein YcaP (DUF421 family)